MMFKLVFDIFRSLFRFAIYILLIFFGIKQLIIFDIRFGIEFAVILAHFGPFWELKRSPNGRPKAPRSHLGGQSEAQEGPKRTQRRQHRYQIGFPIHPRTTLERKLTLGHQLHRKAA